MSLAALWSFIRLTRPLFLVGGVLLYALGNLVAIRDGYTFSLARMLIGQALVTAIQLMTHYTNEYYDQAGDRLNQNRTWFSGGSGILSSNTLSPQVARYSIIATTAIALIFILLAGLQVPGAALIGLFSLVVGWSYSGPPLRLVSSGLGELAASIIVALTVPVVGYMLQSSGSLNPDLLLICLPLLLIHFAMLIAFQIPDLQADQSVGKRTLAVRMGLERVIRLHNFSIFAAFCVILVLTLMDWPGSHYTRLALPLALWQALAVRRLGGQPWMGSPGRGFASLTLGALGLFAGTTVLWMAGIFFR